MSAPTARHELLLRHGKLALPHDEEDSSKTWLYADPVAAEAAREHLYRQVWYGDRPDGETVTVSKSDLDRVLFAAQCYVDLTTNVLGVTHAIEKLRAVWRAMRARSR